MAHTKVEKKTNLFFSRGRHALSDDVMDKDEKDGREEVCVCGGAVDNCKSSTCQTQSSASCMALLAGAKFYE